jgi:predicted nuclease of predicted toxin-antitoxin system
MPVEIYTDESVPVAIAAGLKRRGVKATSARDAGNLGLSDEEQLAYAIANRFLLFTHDDDFILLDAKLREAYKDHWGIVYVHQDKLSIGECIRRLKELADLFEQDDLKNYIEFL